MSPKFGTSGLRGLVSELTPELVSDHVLAFLSACPNGGTVHVGRDLRASSPDIADVVISTVRDAGLTAVDAGALPTPALALSAIASGHAAVMVTGSHIPADRNGLKFYTPQGEISKEDETEILRQLGAKIPSAARGPLRADPLAQRRYIDRYAAAFGSDALAGLRIGIYQHSSVARDLLTALVEMLGAIAVPLGRSEGFVPVDTEAVDKDTRGRLSEWCIEHQLDTVISTDGDADRPLVTDGSGRLIPGDILGPLTARTLGAEVVCTPVSSNGLVDEMGFAAVQRTRIGSPYVIAAMDAVLTEDASVRVIGYEANGGFLLGFVAQGPAGQIMPLMTRDCLLPILAPLATATKTGEGLTELVAALPQRYTAAGRVAGVATEASRAFLADLIHDPEARTAFFEADAQEVALDLTDGLRVRFDNGAVVHIRPSGNAPECRCYAEADTPTRAEALVSAHLRKLTDRLGG